MSAALLTLTLGIGLDLPAPSPAHAIDGGTFTDSFSAATLDEEWAITNEDASSWSLSGGALRLTGQPGDTYQGVNNAKNVFLVDIPAGDFTADVTVDAAVSKVFQGAGLIAWKDIDNYVRSGLTYVGSLSPSGIAIENDVETAAAFRAVSFTDRPGSSRERLRLQRVGSTLTTSYESSPGTWVVASSVQVTFPTTQVGFYALGAQDATPLSAVFDDFTVTAAAGADIAPTGSFALRGTAAAAHVVETPEGLSLAADVPATTLAFSATTTTGGALTLATTDGDRPLAVQEGRLVLGQPGTAGESFRLTDAGGGTVHLRDAAGTGYAGASAAGALVLGSKADAVRFRLASVSRSSGELAIDGDGVGAAIEDTMLGIFFEDINYAADGGLHAELVRNRSFEFNASDNSSFTGMTGWQLVNGGGAAPQPLVVDDATRLNEMNRNHFRLVADSAGDGLRNLGFNRGHAYEAGASYDVSFFARTLTAQDVVVQLQDAAGAVLGSTTVAVDGSDAWKQHTTTITSSATTDAGRLAVLAGAPSVVGLDMISLMPQDRWVGRNGTSVLRKDLATEIAAMKPGFVRFPGGCIVNVNSMYGYGENGQYPRARAYQWKESIGPVESRPTNANFWGYNQSYGIGYYEYFTFAEDMGAMPLPVVPALLTGCGQNRATVDDALLQRHIQDTLDLIEFANGAPTTPWGARRAALGHPEPFGLTHVGVGNEENLPAEYAANFVKFRDAIKAKHPDITVISNSGPDDAGEVFDRHWDFNRANQVDMVDEHYYNDPEWFLLNNRRYDSYDRSGPKVFLGEYASRGNTWWNALTEAAFMTGLQRNADVVELASYAPLLSNEDYVQWFPDAIWFDNDEHWASANWEVQKLFGNNLGDEVVPSTFTGAVNKPITGGVFLSTWNTAAAYDDVRVSDNATGSTLFSDGFTDAGAWTPERGSWSVANGEYVQGSTAVTDARSVVTGAYDQDWTNYTLELKARKTAGSEGFLIGFGAEATDDYYWWNLGGWNNTRSVLQKAEGGGAVEVEALEGRSLTTGKDYAVKIVVSGSKIELYLDGVLQMEYDSSAEERLFQVVTRDRDTGDLVAKVVNTSPDTVRTRVTVSDATVGSTATVTTLTAPSLTTTNTKADKDAVKPVTRQLTGVSPDFTMDFAPSSVTFVRLPAQVKDTTAPQVEVEVSGQSVNGWYGAPVEVRATATDNKAVDRVEFRVDGGAWQPRPGSAGSVAVSGHGQHAVEVRAVDAAGNVGTVRPVSFGIDAEEPVSNATFDAAARTATVRASDSGAGVALIETKTGPSGTWTTYTGPVAVGDGATTVEFRATDRLGNVERPGTLEVPARTTPAATSVTASAKPSRVKQGTSVAVTVTVSATGGGTPTGDVEVRKGGTLLATGRLAGGVTTVTTPTSGLAVGTHVLTVRYPGSATHASSQGSVTVTVQKNR